MIQSNDRIAFHEQIRDGDKVLRPRPVDFSYYRLTPPEHVVNELRPNSFRQTVKPLFPNRGDRSTGEDLVFTWRQRWFAGMFFLKFSGSWPDQARHFAPSLATDRQCLHVNRCVRHRYGSQPTLRTNQEIEDVVNDPHREFCIFAVTLLGFVDLNDVTQ